MFLIFLIVFALILTAFCIYALLRAASMADDITETVYEHIQEQSHDAWDHKN